MDKSNEPLVTVTIADLARGGAGVAREASGRVVFVPLTAPGDVARVRIVSEKKHYAQGDLVELISPSPRRVAPRCPVFGRCGGCEWQHLPYEIQWETKKNGVLQALQRMKVPAAAEVLDELPAVKIWEYRNRIQLRGHGSKLGFYARRTNEVIDIQRCDIAQAGINASLPQLRADGAKLRKPYKVEIEVTESGEVRSSWNQEHAALGFRQVHDEQNLKLQTWVASQLTGSEILYDLYGGNGNLSAGLASRFRELHCVDVSSPKEKPAGFSKNFSFHRSSVLPWLLRANSTSEPVVASSVIIDPPREGLAGDLDEVARGLIRLGATELVLVGCDTDNWARDLSHWLERGWKLKRLAVLDLFPQTHHVEALARLERH